MTIILELVIVIILIMAGRTVPVRVRASVVPVGPTRSGGRTSLGNPDLRAWIHTYATMYLRRGIQKDKKPLSDVKRDLKVMVR